MTIKDLFSIILPSLTLCIALYTFLSNNPKFREFGSRFWGVVIWQLFSIVLCTAALLINKIQEVFFAGKTIPNFLIFLENTFIFITIFFYSISWFSLGRTFYIVYGSLYHLRKKRFLKYTKCFGWIYEKFFHKAFYEDHCRERIVSEFSSIDIQSVKDWDKVKKGGSILVLYDEKIDYTSVIANIIIETIQAEETIDCSMTYKSPIDLCRIIPENMFDKVSIKLSLIDCYSPFYAFDDKVIKHRRQEFMNKGFKFFDAGSFAEVHTAANASWYRFRKICKAQENSYRIPHRTIYDSLSTLIRFSSEEQYILFMRHVITSEKSYGMVSIIFEPISLKKEIANDLSRMADIIIEYTEVNKFIILK